MVAVVAVVVLVLVSDNDTGGGSDGSDDNVTSTTTLSTTTTVPLMIAVVDVVGLDEDEAIAALRAVGLNPLTSILSEASDDIAEGLVIRTHPTAGELVEEAGPVSIVVSTGPAPEG